MKPIESTPVVPVRPIGGETARAVSDTAKRTLPTTPTVAEPAMVERSEALSAGAAAPVDNDRVAQIREAVKSGSYPLVPTTVADAMIAAGFMLIEGKKD